MGEHTLSSEGPNSPLQEARMVGSGNMTATPRGHREQVVSRKRSMGGVDHDRDPNQRSLHLKHYRDGKGPLRSGRSLRASPPDVAVSISRCEANRTHEVVMSHFSSSTEVTSAGVTAMRPEGPRLCPSKILLTNTARGYKLRQLAFFP